MRFLKGCRIYYSVSWQHVEEVLSNVPTEHAIPKRALEIVACVQEDRIRSFGHQLVDSCVDAGKSADAIVRVTCSGTEAGLFEAVM